MMDPAALYQRASKYLELSEYEARVYVFLVMEGVSKARELSTGCGVPRTKVYATLRKLVHKGLVFEVPTEPRKFAPMSPAKAFEESLLQFEERASESATSLVESTKVVSMLEETFEQTELVPRPRKEEVWIVHGRSEVLRKVKEMLSSARKSVILTAKENGFIWVYKSFGKLLDKLVEKGVDVQVETPVNSHNGSLVRELNHVYKVKHLKVASPFLYLCVDSKALFLAMLKGDNAGESERSYGVYCNNKALCELISLLLPKSEKKRSRIKQPIVL